jgi:hypothetical protein
MSSRARKWIVPASVVLALPAAIFGFIVAIESLAGSQGSEGVFGSIFDAWRAQLNAAIVLGPAAAFALLVLGSAHVRREQRGQRTHTIVELDMTQRIAVTAAVIGLTATAIVGYVVSRAGFGSIGG